MRACACVCVCVCVCVIISIITIITIITTTLAGEEGACPATSRSSSKFRTTTPLALRCPSRERRHCLSEQKTGLRRGRGRGAVISSSSSTSSRGRETSPVARVHGTTAKLVSALSHHYVHRVRRRLAQPQQMGSDLPRTSCGASRLGTWDGRQRGHW